MKYAAPCHITGYPFSAQPGIEWLTSNAMLPAGKRSLARHVLLRRLVYSFLPVREPINRAFFLFAIVLSACRPSQDKDSKQPPDGQSITLAAYTTPRETYGKAILPAFQRQFRAQSGKDITIGESYLGSGAQARAIIGGFDADVAALSLEPDIETLRNAGLIKHDWKARKHGGMVTNSIVVIGVRKGNPKNIRTWEDLARPGIEVLTPNVRTSGGAMWNVLAIYGAALRKNAAKPQGDENAAVNLLASILRNVKIMDRGARDSMLTFERGIGDAIITYENEILVGRAQGKQYDYVAPPSTILIENPVALIDSNVDRRGSRAAALALLDFLITAEAQRTYADHGLRPVLESVAAETKGKFAQVPNTFTIADLGGWKEMQRVVFENGGAYDRALIQSREAP